MWATPDPKFAMAQCRVWNTWAWEVFGEYNDRLAPVACIATGDMEGSMAEIERAAIEATLELVGGNRQKAAKVLGIGERTLYRKIKEYGLS